MAPITNSDEGWGGVLLGTKADLEAYVHDFNWNDWGALEPCGLCGCNRSDKPFNKFGFDARWLPTVLNMHRYAIRYKNVGNHPLQFHTAIGPYTSFLDALHILDHKGLTSHVIGNTLWTMLVDKEIAPTYARSLEEINDRLQWP